MKNYQREFIQLILEHKILQFGDFTLKSGRKSPYFFNAGLFNSGVILCRIGLYYAMTIEDHHLSYDVLFGPAYKGIPLVCSTAIALARYEANTAFAFNRKETKDHGEGGSLIGSALKGNVLIIDDVITAGTAIGESIQVIHAAHAKPIGVVVAFDRQEKGNQNCSVIDEIKNNHHIPVIPIITFADVITFIENEPVFLPHKERLLAYRQAYGATS